MKVTLALFPTWSERTTDDVDDYHDDDDSDYRITKIINTKQDWKTSFPWHYVWALQLSLSENRFITRKKLLVGIAHVMNNP